MRLDECSRGAGARVDAVVVSPGCGVRAWSGVVRCPLLLLHVRCARASWGVCAGLCTFESAGRFKPDSRQSNGTSVASSCARHSITLLSSSHFLLHPRHSPPPRSTARALCRRSCTPLTRACGI